MADTVTTQDKAPEKTTKPTTAADPRKEQEEPYNPAKLSLVNLMAHLLKTCLNDRAAVVQARRDLNIWYLAQPLENRLEMARNFRKTLDTGKLVMEALYQSAVEVSSGDWS